VGRVPLRQDLRRRIAGATTDCVGLTKRLLEEQLERGWTSIGKNICEQCVTNSALKHVVTDNLDADKCEYCGRTGEAIAADTDYVMERIGASFETEYTEPVEELPYETAEGGYQGDWFDTWELYYRLGEDIGVDAFVEDMVNAYGDRGWCQRDYFISTVDEALLFSWDRFAELVKYDQRFLILGRNEDDEYHEPYEIAPAELLAKIGQLVVDSGLVRELAPSTPLYRVRPHPADAVYTTATELGTPPRDVAFSNRMSPAGIPHFYGAFETETAIAEVWPEPSEGKEAATIARFTNTTAFSVIDLVALPDIPSIFDEDRRHLRAPLRFLHDFAARIAEPVTAERSDREVVSYVPTQIVSEYFRTLFGHEQTPVHGILFRSSRHDGGTNCALFFSADKCLDAAPVDGVSALVLEDVELHS
jgi:hypothetical protein